MIVCCAASRLSFSAASAFVNVDLRGLHLILALEAIEDRVAQAEIARRACTDTGCCRSRTGAEAPLPWMLALTLTWESMRSSPT